MGIKAVELRPVSTLDDVAWNFRTVATALGDPNRARPWIERLEALRKSTPGRAADTIWVGGGGRTMSSPSVGADWMRLAGLQQRPLNGDRVSLETILVSPPAVLLQSRYRSGQFSRGNEWLNHPIVRSAKSRRLQADGRAWTCMGPLVIAEVERLRAEFR